MVKPANFFQIIVLLTANTAYNKNRGRGDDLYLALFGYDAMSSYLGQVANLLQSARVPIT